MQLLTVFNQVQEFIFIKLFERSLKWLQTKFRPHFTKDKNIIVKQTVYFLHALLVYNLRIMHIL